MSRHKRTSAVYHAGTGVMSRHEYTADQTEFLMAMDRLVRRIAPRRPDCRDVLAVIAGLGYCKVAGE